MKKIFNLLLLVMALSSNGYSTADNSWSIVDKYGKMDPHKLLAKGDEFLNKGIDDSAVICYSLIYNTNAISNNKDLQIIVCDALYLASTIYFYHCDYKASLELLLRALKICEETGYNKRISGIYNNMGNIYYQFDDYKLAKKYFQLAYDYGDNDYCIGAASNNLGGILMNTNSDSALILYRKVFSIQKEPLKNLSNGPLNNIGLIHLRMKNYDSAFFYYHKALNIAATFNEEQAKAIILSNIGILNFKCGNVDSARHYYNMSNEIAQRLKLFNVVADNYLHFSEIEEYLGNTSEAFEYYKKYSVINDSIFNASKYGKVSELQFMYDMQKVDKQIEVLNIEREVHERTIVIQTSLQILTGLALLIISGVLIMLYRKNKNLNQAYNTLVAKNVEIVNSDKANQKLRLEYEDQLRKLQKSNESVETEELTKYRNSSLKDDSKSDLLLSILNVMENTKAFCDVDFTLIKLADMVGSNSAYVSQIINDSFKQNFKTFINDYRIKEARRMLSEPEYKKYSIRSISTMVGFKSRSRFDIIFKEITGITPSFYVRSLTEL